MEMKHGLVNAVAFSERVLYLKRRMESYHKDAQIALDEVLFELERFPVETFDDGDIKTA